MTPEERKKHNEELRQKLRNKKNVMKTSRTSKAILDKKLKNTINNSSSVFNSELLNNLNNTTTQETNENKTQDKTENLEDYL